MANKPKQDWRSSPRRKQIDFVLPQLATLAESPPRGGDWIYEAKLDGYRILAVYGRDGTVSLYTRNGQDWTDRFPAAAKAAAKLTLENTIIDCELVALSAGGKGDFQLLQQAYKSEGGSTVLYVFDVLFLEGHDLRMLPLRERKAILAGMFRGCRSRRLRLVPELQGDPEEILTQACRIGFEGVIAKQAEAPYKSGRNRHWIKLKCGQRQEFVIGGYTLLRNGRGLLGTILVGYYQDGKLRYAGKVGTGYSLELRRELQRTFRPLERSESPFVGKVPGAGKSYWLQPKLVCEVAFSEWTQSGMLRQPVFKSLRHDKRPSQIKREMPRAFS